MILFSITRRIRTWNSKNLWFHEKHGYYFSNSLHI